jgi:hypothetical protein
MLIACFTFYMFSGFYFLYVRVMYFLYVLGFLLFICSSYVAGCHLGRGSRLLEVMLHVTLEVEVGELVTLGNLKQLGELGIGVDNATIRLVLQIVRADVGVDVLANLGAGHLGTDLLTKELGELVTDDGGLHESGGLSVTRAATLLVGSLCGQLHLARHNLLESLEIALHGGEKADELLELGTELSHLQCNGRRLSSNGGSSNRRSHSNGGRRRSKGNLINWGSGLGDDLLGRGLGLGGGGSSSRGGSSSGGGSSSLRCSNHSGLYILHKCHLFK